MIIIPRVLTDLLSEVEEVHAKILSLVFAERALRRCSDMLDPAHLNLSLTYISAARDYINKNGEMSTLVDAHARYFAGRRGGDSLSERIMWVAAIAVAASCQREMEAAGVVVKQLYVPDVVAVAQEAQAAVGSCIAAKHQNDMDDQASVLVRKARWAEARWQLIYLIETAEIPGD